MRSLVLAAALLSLGCNNGSGGGVDSSTNAVYSIVYSTNESPSGVFVGDQVQISAYPVDFNEAVLTATLTYSSSNTSVATVTQSGLIAAVGAGTSSIAMTSGGVTVQLPLTVDGNISDGVVVGPNTATIKVGAQQQFTVVVTTTLGNPAHGKTVNWSTSDPSRATVDNTGKATGVAVTSGVSICAAASDVPTALGCATLTVTP
jgi:uncharacterized protein YjdB